MPNKIAISNTAPPGIITLQQIILELGPYHELFELLIPEKTLWLGYKNEGLDWETFTKFYKRQIRYLAVDKMLKKIAKHLGVEEITLCCYEAAADEKCHRKILFDRLPEEMQGERK